MNATQLTPVPSKKPLHIPERVAQRARENAVLDEATGCRISTYSKGSHGYAQIGWHEDGERIVTLAHRIVWASTHGPIEPGMTVDHTCKTRECVNIEHLRLISNFENARRTFGRDWPLGQCINGHDNAFLVAASAGKKECFICAKYYWKSGSVKVRRIGRARAVNQAKAPKIRPPKTHCRHGHEWIAENHYTRPNGRVECLPCKEVHAKKWHTVARAEAKRAA